MESVEEQLVKFLERSREDMKRGFANLAISVVPRAKPRGTFSSSIE